MEEWNSDEELQYLRLQISPHFYFNILNSIYHSIRLDPDQAEDMMIRLAELMQYYVYDCSSASIPLSREVKNIHNYLALQKIRYAIPPQIKLEVCGETEDKMIAPLVLTTIIENAFRYGLEKQLDHSFLDIRLIVQDYQLQFKVINSVTPENGKLIYDNGSNDFLINRLQQLYPSRHTIRFHNEEQQHSVELDMQLM